MVNIKFARFIVGCCVAWCVIAAMIVFPHPIVAVNIFAAIMSGACCFALD